MTAKFLREVVQTDVIEIINQSLMITKDKIMISSRLFIDLKAESIDLLDIRFELERNFGISITDNEIRESLGINLTQTEVYEKLTVESIITFVNNKLGI
jgi:acyl carrier protein